MSISLKISWPPNFNQFWALRSTWTPLKTSHPRNYNPGCCSHPWSCRGRHGFLSKHPKKWTGLSVRSRSILIGIMNHRMSLAAVQIFIGFFQVKYFWVLSQLYWCRNLLSNISFSQGFTRSVICETSWDSQIIKLSWNSNKDATTISSQYAALRWTVTSCQHPDHWPVHLL